MSNFNSMKKKASFNLTVFLALVCLLGSNSESPAQRSDPYWTDKPYIQEYSIQYPFDDETIELKTAASDRNGYIQVLASGGLLRPRAGGHLFPGTLVDDRQYLPLSDKAVKDLEVLQEQFVYLDDKAVFSNGRAGKLYCRHSLRGAKFFAAGKDFSFLISDGRKLHLVKDSKNLWEGRSGTRVRDIKYDGRNELFWILTGQGIAVFNPSLKKLEPVFRNDRITCMEVAGEQLICGTRNGYFEFDAQKREAGAIHRELPWTEITALRSIGGKLWFGSSRGAFMLADDGTFRYYASKRWVPSDHIMDIAKGPGNSVLILTEKGLGQVCRKEMTLHDKALYFDKQVRSRHIRHGLNSTVGGMTGGDVTSGSLQTSDNDGLWTAMYLAGEVFRYAVTHSGEALENIESSLDAMERLYTVNPVPGFPSRSFQRRGYKFHDKAWRRAEDPEWDWKSTTSSDEAIGHIFAFGTIAELVDVPEIRERAVMLIDTLMGHVVNNDFYLIDWDGNPTLWGKWNPAYVNGLPPMVGDRKLYSSNILAMLQTAYHFTGKEKYRKKAFELIHEHGYLENLMRPMSEIGRAPEHAGDWAKMLSNSWNHSDDEMYYCGYWGLYRYAFNDSLKAMYKKAILDHWETERPEKEGLWNIMTALAGDENYDFEEAVWYLQEYPLDLTDWTVKNSHRKDIRHVPENFRNQTIEAVLPPDELPVRRHNANRFELDGGRDGRSEYSAGDIWLLPYWAGRYLGVISAPVEH